MKKKPYVVVYFNTDTFNRVWNYGVLSTGMKSSPRDEITVNSTYKDKNRKENSQVIGP